MLIKEEKLIIRYIRDNGTPVGVVVGLNGKIGWSQLNPNDRWDRQRGIEIATARAKLSDERDRIKERKPHKRKIYVYTPNGFKHVPFEQELQRNIEIIQRRMK